MDCESWLGSKHTATVQTFCGQRVKGCWCGRQRVQLESHFSDRRSIVSLARIWMSHCQGRSGPSLRQFRHCFLVTSRSDCLWIFLEYCWFRGDFTFSLLFHQGYTNAEWRIWQIFFSLLIDFIKGLQSGRQDCKHFHRNVRIMKVHSQNVGCCAVPRSRRTHYVTWTSCVSGFLQQQQRTKSFAMFFPTPENFCSVSPPCAFFKSIPTLASLIQLCTNINCASLLYFNLLTGYPIYMYTIFIGRWDCF